MSTKIIVPVLSAAMLFCVASALAQDHPGAVDPKGCAPSERLQSNGSGSSATPQVQTDGGNLSDKLARTDGVLCPPNVDPEIKAPTPQGGNMPVIPPPGSPGGNQNVQPK